MGGRRMAEILHKPTVVDFIDQTMMHSELGLQMEEAVISPNSSITGKTLISSNLRQNFGVIIIAIKRITGEMVFNPGPKEVFNAGDVLVVIGKKGELRRMSKAIC
jgi:voltage-gated potassium channel